MSQQVYGEYSTPFTPQSMLGFDNIYSIRMNTPHEMYIGIENIIPNNVYSFLVTKSNSQNVK